MSTVDLSQSKSGDVVHFRCGEYAEIESIGKKSEEVFHVFYKGRSLGILSPWTINGRCYKLKESAFDIVKVESK